MSMVFINSAVNEMNMQICMHRNYIVCNQTSVFVWLHNQYLNQFSHMQKFVSYTAFNYIHEQKKVIQNKTTNNQ